MKAYSKRKKLRGISRKVTRICNSYKVELDPYDANAFGANRYHFPIDPYRVASRVSIGLQKIILQNAIDETYRLIAGKTEQYRNTKFVCLIEPKSMKIEINHFLDQGYYDYFFARGFSRETVAPFNWWDLKRPAEFDAVFVTGYMPEGGLDWNEPFMCIGEVPLEVPSLEGNSYLARMKGLKEKNSVN